MRRPHFINRRRFFRLRFPKNALLHATINGNAYRVVEIAEASMIVDHDGELDSGNDGICLGTIVWSNEKSSSFIGEVGRLSAYGRVIWEIQGIEMQDVIGEQRRLLQRFPGLRESQRQSA
ncbi:MAG: hypothetical protein ACI87E_001642 [Mariniblastus sp.]|jgi:hypothetical protein